MALYEIKEDCRIANKNFSKWDIVSNEEVWWYFPTIMKPCEWTKASKVETPDNDEEPKEVKEESKEEVVEEKKSKKRQSKKK